LSYIGWWVTNPHEKIEGALPTFFFSVIRFHPACLAKGAVDYRPNKQELKANQGLDARGRPRSRFVKQWKIFC
jgi:hypothetical protein